METSSRPRVQVVVAHPDDETFGCGSLLLHAAATGAVTAVCCATRGEAGEAPAGSGLGPGELAVAREAELRDAAHLLGVGHLELLNFADSGMSGPASAQTLAGADPREVHAAVRAAVAAFGPDVLITLDASDGHRDHARIRDVTVAVAEELAVARTYLQCLPRSLMRRWVAQMQIERPEMEHLDADVAQLGTPDEEITAVIDVADHLERREQAIRAHTTQTSPFEGLPADLRRAFLANDHLRRVIPAWSGGAPERSLLDVGPAYAIIQMASTNS